MRRHRVALIEFGWFVRTCHITQAASSGLQNRADEAQCIFEKTLTARLLRLLFGDQTLTVIHVRLLKCMQFLGKFNSIDEEGHLVVEPEAPHIEVDRSEHGCTATQRASLPPQRNRRVSPPKPPTSGELT
jgi:hypothetical protein